MIEIPLKIEEEESLKMAVDEIEKVNVGLPGKSAYEVAQESGFIGTKEEWLASLKGEKGDKGEDGKQGPEGPPGEKGDPGETPTIQNATQAQAGLMSADDKKSLDREFFRMLPKGGTAINTSGTDINTIEFTRVGNYYCSYDVVASTLKNMPTEHSFMMFVLSPLSPVYDNEETAQWCYRLRIMVTYTGEFFAQQCSSGAEAGKFDFGKWKKFKLEEV